jgi:predicted transcriptional regulator
MTNHNWLERVEKNKHASSHLENFYQELVTKIQKEYPKVHIVLQAKLITTRLLEEEKLKLDTACLEIARKIKAVTETLEMLGIELD